jgi:NAD(P)-dependent dehydrogenase (short-subunit alcohol dehydrogenase family)
MTRTVVVTGSAGRLGRAACRELLARGWHVRAFDRCPPCDLTSEAA